MYNFDNDGSTAEVEYCHQCTTTTAYRKHDLTCVLKTAEYCANTSAAEYIFGNQKLASHEITTGVSEDRCECLAGYGRDADTGLCETCTGCSECTIDYIDSATKYKRCTACNAGYALNLVSGQCEECSTDCATCEIIHYVPAKLTEQLRTIANFHSDCPRARRRCLTCTTTDMMLLDGRTGCINKTRCTADNGFMILKDIWEANSVCACANTAHKYDTHLGICAASLVSDGCSVY
jgi:hypothetical protein